MFSLLIKLTFILSLVGFVSTLVIQKTLPNQFTIVPSIIQNNPVQDVSYEEKFTIPINNYVYEISPKYEYEFSGLIVSEYDSQNLLDLSHRQDPGNVKDICIVWGDNIANNTYSKVHYSSGEFTCFVKWDTELNPSFNLTKVANNHIIPANPKVAETIKKAKKGDQIRVKGYLIDYSVMDSGRLVFERNTSVTREDTGNGACEIVYATDASIIQTAHPIASRINNISEYALMISIVSALGIFFLSPYTG